MTDSASFLKREKVYEHIRYQIITRELKPGQRLNERHLSEKLNVGRGTIRESLVRLVVENYVENKPGFGSYVKSYSIEEIKEFCYVRELLEGAAVKFATNKMGRYDGRELQQLIDKLEEACGAEKRESIDEFDELIHFKLADLCGNEVIRSMVHNSFGLQLMMYKGQPLTTELLKEHQDILDAMLEGNAYRAEQLIRAYIKRGTEALVEILEKKAKLENNQELSL